MSIFNRIFGKKEENSNFEIKSYKDFWDWFLTKEEEFFKVIKGHKNIEKDFFDVIAPKLRLINEDYYFLCGMFDDTTAELIITVDGDIKNIVFAEELIAEAPALNHWKFTALKPEMKASNGIEMEGYKFSAENIFFVSNEIENYPDEIDISFVYDGLNDRNKDLITNGICIFLDNFLGELNFATQIDTFNIVNKTDVSGDLIPVSKLKEFLAWREKEFIERNRNVKDIGDEDSYSLFEATLKNGLPLIATINTTALNFDSKSSYPWISVLKIHYDGTKNNGLPENKDFQNLEDIEESAYQKFKTSGDSIYIGRETAENLREIYFANKGFRNPSKILREIVKQNANYKMSLEVYKDKYWQNFERFYVN